LSSCTADGRIRTTQDALTIQLDTCIDITGADGYFIDYCRPDGTTGTWTASLSGTQIVEYTLGDDEFLVPAGAWKFKSRITFANGTTASGLVYTETVFEEWD
jgi:hypothetical protein